MESTKQTSREYFRTLTILHLALKPGDVFAGVIGTALLLIGARSNDPGDLNRILFYFVSGISIGGLVVRFNNC